MLKKLKGIAVSLCALTLVLSLTACNSSKTSGSKKVVIYTNGDEEAVTAMEGALNNAGYDGKYVVQSLGTSELGGKLMVEGDKIEAGLVTMSSYFLDSAQEKNDMFTDLTFKIESIDTHPAFYTPILANTGAIFVNKKVMEDKKLSMPSSIKDLAKPEFKGLVSIPNIMDSSTGWLLVQAIINQYGEKEGKNILHQLIENVGPHLESSGSGPIKKVEAGEVAAGIGLRHQAVLDKKNGLPIEYIDPTEGNFSLTESVAVVKKDEKATELAMKMAEVIIKNARKDLITNYPVALYKGETVSNEHKPAHSMNFSEPLTVDLLEKHQQFFNSAK
jgi:iron(III) transport system substrate-binding protein